jgi:indole-3-acetate monooxygenase
VALITSRSRIFADALIAELWNTIAAGGETTMEQRSRCRLASTYAADCAREAMRLMYLHGGTTSFKRETRLAECWRDLHVVGQTVTIGAEWYAIGRRALLGMDTGPRLR